VNDMYGEWGGRWAIVRPEFLAIPESEYAGGRVLVSFGGTDPAGLTERIVPLLDGLEVRVVQPPGRDGVWRNLAEDMAWADLIVTSGGRTVWEATAARRPCVTVLQNARESTHRHLSLGAGVVNLGLAGLVDDEIVGRTVQRLASSPATLTDLASRMVGVVDGRGADRIVAECERIIGGL
jgi:spore coat polysaccharide biosynthesis predicted glycosyltransferase SpsG